MSRENGRFTKVVRLPSNEKEYFAIESWWFTNFVSRAMGEVHNCYTSKTGKEIESK